MSRRAESRQSEIIVGMFTPQEDVVHSPQSISRPVTINPEIVKMFAEAGRYQHYGFHGKAKDAFREAATNAKSEYLGISVHGITTERRHYRARMGEVALIAFISAGDFDEASRLAELLLEDPFVSESSRMRINSSVDVIDRNITDKFS